MKKKVTKTASAAPVKVQAVKKTEKKAAPVAKKAEVKKAAAPAEKVEVKKAAAPVKKEAAKAPAKKVAPVKKEAAKAPAKKAAPVKKEAAKAPAKKAAPVKKEVAKAPVAKAPAKKEIAKAPAKKAAPVKKEVAKAPVAKAPAKKAAPVKKEVAKAPVAKAPAKKAAPVKKEVAKAPVAKAPVAKAPAKKEEVEHVVRHKKLRLNKKKQKFYTSLLLELRSVFTEQVEFHKEDALSSKKDSAGERAGMATHMADLGSDNFRHDLELGLMSDEGDVLEMIDEALQRIESSEYGICLECGCEINPERLEAKPYARFCVKCKSAIEKLEDPRRRHR